MHIELCICALLGDHTKCWMPYYSLQVVARTMHDSGVKWCILLRLSQADTTTASIAVHAHSLCPWTPYSARHLLYTCSARTQNGSATDAYLCARGGCRPSVHIRIGDAKLDVLSSLTCIARVLATEITARRHRCFDSITLSATELESITSKVTNTKRSRFLLQTQE